MKAKMTLCQLKRDPDVKSFLLKEDIFGKKRTCDYVYTSPFSCAVGRRWELTPGVKTTAGRDRCRNVKEGVIVNKKKIIEKEIKKLNRLTGGTFSIDYECVGSKCSFRLW
jgi:hypothetical protein